MSLPSVLIRKSTGDVLSRANYPRADMGPIIGLDPDLEWCVIRTPFSEPNYDPRYYSLVTTEGRGAEADSQYPHLFPWLVTFSTLKRSAPEIKVSVENKERTELSNHIKEVESLKLSLLGLAILFRQVSGLSLTPRETVIKQKLIDIAVKVWQNDDRLQEILNQVNNNQEPDIDSGWASP